MSRVSDLENKVAALERNVGMLAKLADVDDCLKIGEYSSIVHYKEGCKEATEYVLRQEEVKELERELESRRRELEAQFVKSDLKSNISLVINKTPIYEYDGTAIYDLHTPAKLAYIWKTSIFAGGDVIRSMTVSDIKKFFYDNPLFEAPEFFDIVQDINHMSDIYIIDKTKF